MSPHVGLRTVDDVDDPVRGVRVPVTLLYPSRTRGEAVRFGPYEIVGARDAAPDGDRMPLVAVSHGTGGSPYVYRDLAAHLARAGFAVALVVHPGNNRDDDRLAHTVQNLEDRPRHLRLALDAAYADALVGPHLQPGAVAVVGHSMGGYTALAVAGGRPMSSPYDAPSGPPRPVPVTPDARVRALVLLAPATVWYAHEGALAEVRAPILLRTAEKDELAPPFFGDLVVRGVPDAARVEHAVVPGAGHFAFLTPFPPHMARPGFLPAQDPAGLRPGRVPAGALRRGDGVPAARACTVRQEPRKREDAKARRRQGGDGISRRRFASARVRRPPSGRAGAPRRGGPRRPRRACTGRSPRRASPRRCPGPGARAPRG